MPQSFVPKANSWFRVEVANLCVLCPEKDISGLLMEEDPPEERVRQMGEAVVPAGPPSSSFEAPPVNCDPSGHSARTQ